ncbi:GTP binding protein-like protein Bud4 [Aaosphaeria arxii CBS 175.79]|uniref:GTP binding protein-like protein Bud4 n=1 Tax=Aaosphaeria arxii CBS 175.79 TaxID=1450172 RepID=A0A6A5XR53_9PLEO|nr:GTP binding protein-like protein Bud4 [Aaosphaeria arxii CBS 175.79]KAF2015376.1 GTP binding protein-like protein Bud4 [Aaosphaeria arxii CBS 175.79]
MLSAALKVVLVADVESLQQVSPLRINKTPNGSPTKPVSRPLSEIGPTEHRRNSPSFNQATKKMMFTKEASPFDTSSPFTNSPRLFWKEQTISPKARFGSENDSDRDLSLSPKRSSIENLKKASRVKNSSMFAREQKNEYDPASVQVPNRPLASGRPLSYQVQGNAFGGNGLAGLRQQNEEHKGHRRGESLSKIPTLSPSKTSPAKLPTQSSFSSFTQENSSPAEGRASPTKSSLVSHGRFNSFDYNPESSIWSDDEELKHQTPRPLRRHAKSVTFDAAPPTINEYEMVTPDPSSIASDSREGSYESDEEDMSFDQDDSFDASLEDTDKTPVVLPEDWRHMSPEAANTSLADTWDDVFDGRDNSPMPNAQPIAATKPNGSRHGSTNSEGEARPLPPLPGMQAFDDRNRRDSSIGLSAAAERASGARRSLPQPPQAAGISKADLLNMREGSMSLEDRLRLMNFDDERDTQTPTQESEDKKIAQVEVAEVDDVTESEIIESPKVQRISRESILRKVKSRNFDDYETYDFDPESSPERSYGDLADLDPDVPIPSREVSSNFDETAHEQANNTEDEMDSVLEAYSMAETTEVYAETSEISQMEEYDCSVIHHIIKEEPREEDEASQYSSQQEEQPTSQSTIDTSGPPTPTALDSSPNAADKGSRRSELFASFADTEMDLHLDPLKASFETAPSPLDTAPKIGAMREFLRRPETPDATEEDLDVEEPGTPDSVIRHPVVEEPEQVEQVENVEQAEEAEDAKEAEKEAEVEPESPAVPDPEATVRGAGGKLKTRPSLIPADMDMAATRRQVSGEHPPPVPQRSPKRQSLSLDFGYVEEESSQASNVDNSRMLDIAIGEDSNDLSFGLDKDFDKIIEAQKVDFLFPLPSFAQFPTSSAAQTHGANLMSGEGFVYTHEPTTNTSGREQKGYLMRQNTKVVVASSRQFSDEKPPTGSSDKPAQSAASRKTSAERKPAWTTEPWNGKARRRSIRTTSGTRRAAPSGPAPPLPGQESAVAGGLDSVEEQNSEEFEDGAERGRLFVKVVGVKDLDLPLPKNEKTWFQLTLDNGLHCVTTSWLELGHSAPIGQEFELVVLDDLEFQLTLQTKLQPPAKAPVTAAPVRVVNHKKSHSAFRNLLSSPKKRKEQERKQQEEAERLAQQQQQQQEAQAKRNHQATAWDLLHGLVGPDGSFARAYVCLKNHENQAYGRPLNVDIPCFNEWAVDDSGVSSVKSKRGGVVRRPPYRVGKLALQLLYVPKPKNAKDEDMPKSMNACVRELKEAEEVKGKTWEGHLSQQGGDCPYWRRRFFRLAGTKLTAYHESTRQPRATINLAKATKLIDDKSALQQPSSTKSGGRRKSAFSEEEEGYMFVEEGFRIRFANGEVIDFYADSTEQKEGWMKVLSETVGKDLATSKAWTQMVIDKERQDKARSKGVAQPAPPKDAFNGTQQQRPRSHEGLASKSAPSSPVKGHSRTKSHVPMSQAPPPPIEKDARHKMAAPRQQQQAASNSSRREQVRSMIF